MQVSYVRSFCLKTIILSRWCETSTFHVWQHLRAWMRTCEPTAWTNEMKSMRKEHGFTKRSKKSKYFVRVWKKQEFESFGEGVHCLNSTGTSRTGRILGSPTELRAKSTGFHVKILFFRPTEVCSVHLLVVFFSVFHISEAVGDSTWLFLDDTRVIKSF